MKKIVFLLLATCLMLQMQVVSYGSQAVHIRVNDVVTDLGHDVIIVDNQTYVPLEEAVMVLGASLVRADESGDLVMFMDDVNCYVFYSGAPYYFVDGVRYEGETKVIKEGDTLYIALRTISDMMGFDLAWNDTYRTIELSKASFELEDQYVSPVQYTYEEIIWLARLVNFEGYDIGYEPKLAVANVVLNRVRAGHFPNGIYDVIYDTNYAVQFPPAHRDKFKTYEPNEESMDAAMDALGGINNIENCLYFNNTPFTVHTLYKVIEGEYFYIE